MSPGAQSRWGKSGLGDDVLRGPKLPTWSCSCGQDGNWASRIICRGCGKNAPKSISEKARAAAKQQQIQQSQPQQAQGKWANGPPQQTGKQAARIRQLEEEVRKLRADKEFVPLGNDDTSKADKQEVDAELDKLRADIHALEGIAGGEALLSEKRVKLQTLVQERQAARPLHRQLRDLQGKIDRKEKALKRRLESELPDLRKKAEAAQQAVSKAEDDVRVLEAELLALRAQKEAAKASEPLHCDSINAFGGGWRRTDELLQSLSGQCAEGQAQENYQELRLLLQSLQATNVGANAAAVGHRPPGTAMVVSGLVAEGKAASEAHLQAQLTAFKTEAEELQVLWADLDDDMASDLESVALEESSEQAAERRQQKSERSAARAAKRKKIGDRLRVISKMSKCG